MTLNLTFSIYDGWSVTKQAVVNTDHGALVTTIEISMDELPENVIWNVSITLFYSSGVSTVVSSSIKLSKYVQQS